VAVTTNATNGYSVTVQQNQDLTNAAGATIHAFPAGGSPAAWSDPAGTLNATTTYGHLAFTTDDTTLTAGNPYGGSKWNGFSGGTPVEVLYNGGPADGSTQGKAVANVAFRIAITSLQDAGDYTNTLTYIATPAF
jgi:hypothetical protein